MYRIGSEGYYRTIVNDLFNLQYAQYKTEKEIATGKTVNEPSDAPGYSVSIMDSLRSLEVIEQYNYNLSAADNWITASESSMQSILDIITEAQTLAEQMSTGTYDELEQLGASGEIGSLVEEIVALLNTNLDGYYIFGGTNTTESTISALIQETDYGPGTGAVAEFYYDGSEYHLQLSRDTDGASATLTFAADNTLGDSISGISFDTWTTLQEASGQPATAQISYSSAGVADLWEAISAAVGEELIWVGDGEAGEQVNRSNWELTVSGACTVSVDGNNHACTDAADLVSVINAAGNDYFAWLEGEDIVHIEPRTTGSFEVEAVAGAANVEIARDTSAGAQVYRTAAEIEVTGEGTVTIGADNYTFTDAAALVEAINQTPGRDYFAWLEGDGIVHIQATGTGDSFSITNPTGGAVVNQTTTMQELRDQINSGLQATGMIHLSGVPADADTITIGQETWNWEDIKGNATPVTAAEAAQILTDWINAHSDDFYAETTSSGTGATVQLMARVAGKAGNVAVAVSGANLSTIGGTYGGLDPTELTPLVTNPQAEDRSSLLSDSAEGHGTYADTQTIGSYSYLQFTRDSSGTGSTFSSIGGDLGTSTTVSLDFTNYQITRHATSSSGEIIRFNGSQVSDPAVDLVSDRIGEELSWLADGDAGLQTYRTDATISFVEPAGAQVDINGDIYAVDTAEELVNAVNATQDSVDYFALLVDGTTVRIVSQDSGPFYISEVAPPSGNLTIDQEITMDDLVADINAGLNASGMVHLDNDEALITITGTSSANTVTVEGNVYTLTSANSASALAAAINLDPAASGLYYAYLDDPPGNDVHIVALTATTIDVTGAAGLVVSTDTTAIGGLPAAGDTITLGDQVWTWAQITGDANLNTADSRLRSADEYANALASFINRNTDEFSANATSLSDAGDHSVGASVQISARAVGDEGNVDLISSNNLVETSAQLWGGMDGQETETTGHLQGSGTASLRLSTTIQATVLEVDGDDVTLRLRWYGDYGELHEQDITLGDFGEDNGVEVQGMGGFKIYRDDLEFHEGAILTLEVGHDQGNEEDLAINYAEDSHLSMNWTAEEVAGGHLQSNLYGETADSNPGNTGNAQVHLTGSYRGMLSRDLSFTVISSGQPPTSEATVRVTWTDDNGDEQQAEVTVSGTGLANAVEIPDCDGVSFYITNQESDSGTALQLDQGDNFYHEIEKNPVSILDTLVQWQYKLANGDQEAAQTESQRVLEALNLAAENLTSLISAAGTRLDRTSVRSQVLEDQELFHSQTLEDLQEVNLTQAFLDLSAQQTAYNSSLSVISAMSGMYLVNFL